MSPKLFFIGCCCLLPMLVACSDDTFIEHNEPGNSMLVIGAQLDAMNPVGDVYNKRYIVSEVSVKNLSTGQVYSMDLDADHAVAELPSGTYCFNSISPENSSALVYCGKPFFTLAPQKIVVTGYFIFAIDYSDNSYALKNSFIDKQGLFNRLSKAEIKSLEDFDGQGN
ncbi:MAG: hypothetical protein WBR15_10135 [Gammaproteobacteria bacterium]